MAQETEGVIKYTHDFTADVLPPDVLDDIGTNLTHWRQIFFTHDLIGEDPARYGGLGYGNLSVRLSRTPSRFVITGTQTSGKPELDPATDYAVVQRFNLTRNNLSATGITAPSSEAMTHAAVYKTDPDITAVFHAHSPDIWHVSDELGIAATGSDIPYGTPEMAAAVQELVRDPAVRQAGIIAMKGHEDGIITFGETPNVAGRTMLAHLHATRDTK